MPADKQTPEPAEILATRELSDIQFDALDAEAPMEEMGDKLLPPKFLPKTVTDCSPVVSITDTKCENMKGGLNETMEETVPNTLEALIATGNNLDAPEETFCLSTESLTQTVANEEDLLNTLRCEITVFANFVPMIVRLEDPETGSKEEKTLTGAGALNEMVLEMHERNSKETHIDNLGPKPLLVFVTMADSDTHKWNSVLDDSRRILGEYDAKPNRMPASTTIELPDVGTNETLFERARAALYEAQSTSEWDFWRKTDTAKPNLALWPMGTLDFKDESEHHCELNEPDFWNLEAAVMPCTLNVEPMMVKDKDPDLARFVMVSEKIAGAVMDNTLANSEPILLPRLARIEMDKPSTTCDLHKAEESDVHNETCALLLPVVVAIDEWYMANAEP
jgi:hypothetical protein